MPGQSFRHCKGQINKCAAIKTKATYIELKCFVSGLEAEATEILTARLLRLGFEGFWEEGRVLTAYIGSESFSPQLLEGLDGFKYEYRLLEPRNWNQEWEKNFSPVVIAGKCLVRAPFHPPQGNFPLEVIIEPKMAFGTGHHPTTEMIAGYLLATELKGTFLFDMGCGTGILGIIARKAGAGEVVMADNDPEAVTNARENVSLNRVDHVTVCQGGTEILRNMTPGIITANITRTVLISQMAVYFSSLKSGGTLVVSGIIEPDYNELLKSAREQGFGLKEVKRRREWLMLVFVKPELI
jgi:ribosomal protein L11 methyltransferase